MGREIGGDTDTWRDQRWKNPWGPKGTWAQAESDKGERTDAGDGRGSRHTARGAEMSGRGWKLAGGEKVQVDDDPRRERMWGAGVKER